MFIIDILQIPIEFIKEHLTGWVLLIFTIFIIYFICLRKYYIQREKFYDISTQLKTLKNIESVEDSIKTQNEPNLSNKFMNKKFMNKKYNTSRKEYKQEKKVIKKSNDINTATREEDNIFEEFNNNIPTISQVSNKSNKTNENENMPPIATTLFDNLNLNNTQIQDCKNNYNQVIAQLIIDLGKLSDMSSRNRYLNLKKQFDSILAKSIDTIMNYLTLTIKSPRILTRTSIRTDIINTLSNVLDNLVNKTNQELTDAMNKLAMMNSTTVDYNSQLSNINDSRASLEKYINIDKLLNELGHNISVSQKEISNILDKSYILPIYERNFDKISQIAKSDFNNNEGDLTMKYSKAYAEFLEQEKKEELNINPLSLASQIESGIVNMLSYIGDASKNRKGKDTEIKDIANITGEYGDNWYVSNGELREQLTRDYGFTNDSSKNNISNVANNPIPKKEQAGDLLNNTQFNRENIFSDPSNRGSYMINPKTQCDILEGFENNITTENKPIMINSTTTSPSLIKAFDNSKNNKNKKQESNIDITSKLLSGDFLQYMLDTINGYMEGGYDIYKNKLNNYIGNVVNVDSNGFKLEDNMIPAGFALFILSMLFYFVDVSS